MEWRSRSVQRGSDDYLRLYITMRPTAPGSSLSAGAAVDLLPHRSAGVLDVGEIPTAAKLGAAASGCRTLLGELPSTGCLYSNTTVR